MVISQTVARHLHFWNPACVHLAGCPANAGTYILYCRRWGKATYYSLAKISKNVTNYSPTVRTNSSAQPLQCLDFVFHDGIFCKGPTAFRRRHDLVAGADLAPWPTTVTSFKIDERSWHYRVDRFALTCSVFGVFCGLDQLPRHNLRFEV